MGADRASSQQVVEVLKTKAKSRRSQKFSSIFSVTDEQLLREAGTKMICQVLKASMKVQT